MLRQGLVAALMLCLSTGLSYPQPLSSEEALERIQPLVAELIALRAINAMNLSPQQARDLLAIARRAQSVWNEYHQRMKEVLREQLEAFTAFKAEDLLNVGFSPETERRAAIANQKGKNLTKWLADSLAPLCEEAAGILTGEQCSIAERMSSVNLAPALRARLVSTPKRTDRVLDPVVKIKQELAAIHRAEYGEITPLGRFLLNPALVNVLERGLGLTPSPVKPLVDKEFIELEGKVRTLRADINMLNLINDLHLTTKQLRQLEEMIQSASDSFTEGQPYVDPKAFNELVRALQGVRQLLLSGRDTPLPTLVRAFQIAWMANLLPRPSPQSVRIGEVAHRVLSILTEEQKQVLADYKPHLIPPKNLKDPVRVGQAPNNTGYIRALEQLRQIPPAIYTRRKGQIVERLAEQIERIGGAYPPEEREVFVQHLTELIDKVRSLSDEDFAIQSEELANEFRKLYRKEAFEVRLKELTFDRKDEVLLSKVIANLLHPCLTTILTERKLAQANLKPGEGEGLKSLTVYNTGGICPKPQAPKCRAFKEMLFVFATFIGLSGTTGSLSPVGGDGSHEGAGTSSIREEGFRDDGGHIGRGGWRSVG